ncbi:MAG: hypothetical protein IPM80_01885 [Proteobacteria bacterium]|nr:hypothetical protein [Pseudomonadota bacterium]
MGALSAAGAGRRTLAAASLLWASLAAALDDATLLMSPRPLLPAWLRVVEASIVINADSIEWRGHELRDVELPATLHGGALEVQGASARLAGGQVRIGARRDAEGAATLDLSASHVILGELAALRPFVSGVPVDVEAQLRGDGASAHAFAASASGRVQLRNTGNGIVRHGFEEVGDNLVYHFISAFEVFRRAGTDAYLECVALDLPFANGVARARKSMELRTKRLWVRGGGTIDLRDESIDLVFKPETRGALKLQSLKVVERVRVRGALGSPEVILDSAHLVGRAARLGLDVANLGGGAVFNRLLKRKPAPGLCAGALAAPLTRP